MGQRFLEGELTMTALDRRFLVSQEQKYPRRKVPLNGTARFDLLHQGCDLAQQFSAESVMSSCGLENSVSSVLSEERVIVFPLRNRVGAKNSSAKPG